MLTATISQVKNGLSAYLRRVEAGETVLIMNRKTPVARLVPLTHRIAPSATSSHDDRARIEKLIVEGVATRMSDRGALDVLHELGESWPDGHGLLETLLTERQAEYGQGWR